MNDLKAQITQETLDLAKQAFESYGDQPPTGPGLRKQGINIAENLVGINLEAPSKKLYPVYSPLRNRFARVQAPIGANAVQWRQIDAINSTKISPGVAENTRNAFNVTATQSQTATFKTLGHDDFVGFEALYRSKGFEDVRATAALNLLYSVMISEEQVILGGQSTDIGAPANLSVTPQTTGGSLATGDYFVRVSALVIKGTEKGEKAAAGPGANEADGESITVDSATIAVTGPNGSIDATWDALRGAVAYNVFLTDESDAVGLAKFIATVFTCAFTFQADGGTGAQANTVDATGDANEYDGVISQIEANNGTLFRDLQNAQLTSDGSGGIVEFDSVMKEMWDRFRLGPTAILVNSQQAADITAKIGGSSNLAYRVYLQDGQRNIVGGIYVGSYLNKFASSFAEGFPNEVPIKIHPVLPAGNIIFVVETLPYPNNQVPNVWEIETLQDYTQYEWALNQRRYEFGIYHQSVLKGYFPSAQATIVCVRSG